MWYVAHLGQQECVPLHNVDLDDLDHPLAFGDRTFTPGAFVDALKEHFGPRTRNITLTMKNPDVAVVSVDVTLEKPFQTVLLRGLDLCEVAMDSVRSRR
jgi:hypothetical protein